MPSWYRDPDAPAPNRPRRCGVTAIVEMRGGVLVGRRSDDGAWAFLGGGIEDDETILDALHRELLEETSLEIEAARLVGVFSDPSRLIGYEHGHVNRALSFAFAVVPRPGEPRPNHETLELRVVPRRQLRSLPLWPVAAPVLDAYLAFDGTVVVA